MPKLTSKPNLPTQNAGPSSSGLEENPSRLLKADRIRRRSVFQRVQGEGERTHTRHFLILQYPSQDGRTRLGVTVTRKIGNAVARNRVKRLVREVFRQNRSYFGEAIDVVFIAKRNAPTLSYEDVLTEVQRASRSLTRARGKLPPSYLD